jgi:hypothetical protein
MNRDDVEAQIRQLLSSETNYWKLSDMLFGPDGLFGKLGSTVEERKFVGRSPLFRQAQKRIRDMEYEIAERLRREMKQRPASVERSKNV